MKLTGKMIDLLVDYKTNKPRLTLEVDEKQEAFNGWDELHDERLAIEIKKYHPKRSKNANSYCWELIGQLAQKLGIPADEIYREAIRKMGTFQMVFVRDEGVEALKSAWESQGLGWICETYNSSIDGYCDARLWYGSSHYDSAEMARLIEYIVDECKLQGISTETPEELARMTEEWH